MKLHVFKKLLNLTLFFTHVFGKLLKQIRIESWFLAAEKGSEFIRLWCDEAMRIHNFHEKEEYSIYKINIETSKYQNMDMVYEYIYILMREKVS